MFLSAKTKGYFVDCTEESLLLARTSAAAPPFVVEAIQECPLGDADVIAGALKVLQGAFKDQFEAGLDIRRSWKH